NHVSKVVPIKGISKRPQIPKRSGLSHLDIDRYWLAYSKESLEGLSTLATGHFRPTLRVSRAVRCRPYCCLAHRSVRGACTFFPSLRSIEDEPLLTSLHMWLLGTAFLRFFLSQQLADRLALVLVGLLFEELPIPSDVLVVDVLFHRANLPR